MMRAKHWGLRLGITLAFLTLAVCCGGSDSVGNNGGSAGTGGGSATTTTTGSGGRGGSGGAGGQGGGVACGASVCAAGQICCPGCEPGTGTCYVGGCPGSACPQPSDASGDHPTDATTTVPAPARAS